MKLVIGLVGEKGSGKQTFVNFLKDIASSIVIPSTSTSLSIEGSHSTDSIKSVEKIPPLPSVGRNDIAIRQVRFSDILNQTFLIWDLPNTRENQQKLAESMEKTFGSGTLAHAMEFHIANETSDIIILDGIRRQPEAAILKKFPQSLLVYITAEQKLRYERLKNRSEKKGEQGMPWEQFLREEQSPAEKSIPALGAQADVKLENNDSLGEFKSKVEDFLKNHLTA